MRRGPREALAGKMARRGVDGAGEFSVQTAGFKNAGRSPAAKTG